MTSLERDAVAALAGARMPKQRDDLGFVRFLIYRDKMEPARDLTLREWERLWYCVHRYRRQLADPRVLAQAAQVVNAARGTPVLSFSSAQRAARVEDF